jgi:hypothetical protein
MAGRSVGSFYFPVAIISVLAWTIYGISSGIPFAVNELAYMGIIEVGNPGTFGLLLSVIFLILALPFWVGIPLYCLYFFSLLKDGKTFSQALKESFTEYFALAGGGAIGTLVLLAIAVTGRTIVIAIYTGALFALLGAFVLYLAKSIFMKIR